MSCRAASGGLRLDVVETGPLAEVYVDLVRADRRDDFRWLARSQGLAASRAEELWALLSRRLGRPD